MKKKKRIFLPVLVTSLITHILVIGLSLHDKQEKKQQHQFKIQNIRTVGQASAKKKNLFYLKTKHKKTALKDLAFKDLPIPNTNHMVAKQSKSIKKAPKFKRLKINNNQIKNFLKSSPQGFQTSNQALRALNATDVNIALEVPKGIAQDKLNKHEMVFYGFQKRTVKAYIGSFQKELYSFEKSNPHLRFPITRSKQKLSGRVVYDKNGDVLRIETLQYTNIEKLQEFFMKVLKNMSSLPNPPKELLENEQFAINFVLTLNN